MVYQWKKINLQAYQRVGRKYDFVRPLRAYSYIAKYFAPIIRKYIKSGNKILDAGCGTGNSTHFLDVILKNCTIDGIDISENMILAAKKKSFRNKTSFICEDIDCLKKGKYEAALFFMVLHHFKDLSKPLLSVKKVLKKDGKLIVMGIFSRNIFFQFLDWWYRNFFGQGKYVKRDYRDMKRLLKGNGFEFLEMKTHPWLKNYTLMVFEPSKRNV